MMKLQKKKKTLNEKQKVLDRQFVQISKQQGEITVQKQTIVLTAERGSGTEGYSYKSERKDNNSAGKN